MSNPRAPSVGCRQKRCTALLQRIYIRHPLTLCSFSYTVECTTNAFQILLCIDVFLEFDMLNTVLKQLKSHPAVSISDLILMMLMSVNDEDSFILSNHVSESFQALHPLLEG